MIVGHRGLGQDRDAGARRDEIGDEPDALDLDRDAELGVLGRAPRRRPRPAAGCPAAEGSADAPRAREQHRLAYAQRERRRARGRRGLRREVLDDEARIGDRFGHDRAARATRSATSTARRSDAPSVSRSDNPGATRRISTTNARHQRTAHGSDDAQGRVPGFEALQHRQVLAERLELAADRPGPGRSRARRTRSARCRGGCGRAAARRARPRAGGHGPTRSTARCAAGRRRP